MAAVNKQQSVIDERQIRLVTKPSHNNQRTLPAGEALVAGDPIRVDATTGRWVKANAASAANAATFVAWRTVAIGESLTGVRGCSVDFLDLSALNYGAVVQVSDTGTYADVAGTAANPIGTVMPVFATLLGTAADKVLDLNSFGH